MAVKTLTINDRPISARESETILEAAQDDHLSTPQGRKESGLVVSD